MRGSAILAVVLLAALVRGQELLWELHSVSEIKYSGCTPSFGDYDQDGSEDLLVGSTDFRLLFPLTLLRVLSGVDGSVLAEMYPPYDSGNLREAGDFDGDGRPDIAFFQGHPAIAVYFEVWSIATGARLVQIPNIVLGSHGGAHACNLDVTGDGWPDVVFVQGDAVIRVHDHKGNPVYTIPSLSLGFSPTDVLAVGDLDNDGCDDFLVGAAEYLSGQQLGAVILFSGRTGTALRVHWGQQPFDFLNRDLRLAGDVDGDGVVDYAAGNYSGLRGIVMIWSGATGALIREWVSSNPIYFGGRFLAGRDVDLDGRPDMINMAGGYPNVPGQSAFQGRVRTFSSRDGQELIHVASQQWTTIFTETYADLGVQPRNPYPVFAIFDDPIVPPFNNWRRIRVYRCSPAGTGLVGVGGTNTAIIPTIGIRRVDGVSADTSRLVLGSAPANALALCVVAPASWTAYGGVATPFPLDLLGMPGCNLLVPPLLIEPRLTGSSGMDTGYAAFDFPSTMTAANGTQFAAQWVVLDPTTLDHATTQRLEFRVQ